MRLQESLLVAIYALGHDELMERVRERVAAEASAAAMLHAAVRATLEYFDGELAFARAVGSFPPIGPAGSSSASEAIRRRVAMYTDFLAELLAHGVEAGEFRSHDPAESGRVLTHLTYAEIAARVLGESKDRSERAADRILDYFIRGVEARK